MDSETGKPQGVTVRRFGDGGGGSSLRNSDDSETGAGGKLRGGLPRVSEELHFFAGDGGRR